MGELIISEEALRRNARTIVGEVGCPVIGVVKCGGYGAGLLTAAKVWQDAGAGMLAVSRPEEALALRHGGVTGDILLLAPAADADTLNRLVKENIILTVTSPEMGQFYAKSAQSRPVRVHIAVDTGMGRLGLSWTDTEAARELYNIPGLAVEGIFSHFAASFEKRYDKTRTQLRRFLTLTERLEGSGINVGLRHIANTCAALRFPDTRLDAVRIGSGLVGVTQRAVPVSLERAGICRAQVVDINYLRPGDTVGYASIYRVKRPTKAAVIAIGYEDGFGYMRCPDGFSLRYLARDVLRVLRRLKRPLTVTFKGQELPLIGRVGNQYTLFDARETDISPGDRVEVRTDILFPRRNY